MHCESVAITVVAIAAAMAVVSVAIDAVRL
jgi:hypothetical protein